jgi:hypothetical protein
MIGDAKYPKSWYSTPNLPEWTRDVVLFFLVKNAPIKVPPFGTARQRNST